MPEQLLETFMAQGGKASGGLLWTPALPHGPTLLLAGCPQAEEGREGQTSLRKNQALPAAFLTVLPCVPDFFSCAPRFGLPWPGSIAGLLAELYPAAEREFDCFSSCGLCRLHGHNIREGREGGYTTDGLTGRSQRLCEGGSPT